MKKALFPLILCWIAASGLSAQKNVTKQTLAWYSGSVSVQFTPRWAWQLDFSERFFIDPFAQHQMQIRTQARYSFLKPRVEVAAGFSIFGQSPQRPQSTNNLIVPELRPHIESVYRNNLKILSLEHRIRAEARFFHGTDTLRTKLMNGFAFGNFRFRYRLIATIPIMQIDEKRSFKMRIGDEVMMNAGKNIVKNIFDQNRAFVSLSIDVLPGLTFDAGYMNIYQIRADGSFFNRHIITLATQYAIALKQRSKHKDKTTQ